MRLTARHVPHSVYGMIRKRRRKAAAKGESLPGIGAIIRNRRERLRITREELRSRSRVSLRVLAALESDEAWNPRRLTIERLADALHITTDQLLGRSA